MVDPYVVNHWVYDVHVHRGRDAAGPGAFGKGAILIVGEGDLAAARYVVKLMPVMSDQSANAWTASDWPAAFTPFVSPAE